MHESHTQYDVVAIGEILIDLVAAQPSASLYAAPAFIPAPGGAPANVAVGVQRLGRRAAFIGKVGNDDFGRGLRALLEQEGVEARNLIADPDHSTTLALVALAPDGEPHFTFAAGAHAYLQADEVDTEMLRQTRIAHCGSVALAHEPSRATTVTLLNLAKAAGAICSYDVNWRPNLWRDPAAGLALARQPLAVADVCKLNAAELRLLTGVADSDAALVALETNAALVVATLGAAGCVFRLGDTIQRVAATPVGAVVDAIGAGDAFMAALLAGLPDHPARLTPDAIIPALARANRAGAISVTRPGAIPALPYAHELNT